MQEKHIEQKLVKLIRTHGGLCWKLASPGTAGVPDRLVILPGGKTIFIELKAPGGKPRPLQIRQLAKLEKLGHQTLVINSIKQLQELDHALQATSLPDTSNHTPAHQ